ncbi:MAG: CDP-glycerol glycerophosphotransferase family protein [Clostridia bacterium]|nr:CDP-glycerol glycerophosphotransferase family protein [Clostridia bacterium]
MAKPYTLKMKVKHLAIKFLMTAFRVCPINRKKIVICSYFGKGYGDNGKALAEALLSLDPELDVVWGVKPQFADTLPENIRAVDYNSIKYLWELATAGAWIDNSRKNAGITKRKKQFYVQTWHGTVALKRIEQDVQENLDAFYVAGAKNDSKMANVILSGCRFFTELCKKAFWFDGEILECGSPRSDALFNTDSEKQLKVKASLGIPADKKVVLYAPTFRADGNLDCYNMDFEAVLDALEKKTGDSWVFCMRLHPNVSDKADFIKYSDRIFSGTNYPDLYELIPACDMVISDYSSVMFDAGLINKPVMLFANDIQSYAADRNFYFDIRKLPFDLAESNEQLLDCIENFDSDGYLERLDAFNKQIGFCENGTASKSVAERILKEIDG